MYTYALGHFKALMCFTINALAPRRSVFSVTAGTVGRCRAVRKRPRVAVNFICDRVGRVLSGYVCLVIWSESAILQTKPAALGAFLSK